MRNVAGERRTERSGPHRLDYAVAWRRDVDAATATGRLELAGDELLLRGSDASGSTRLERVLLDRVAAVRVGRTRPERVGGERPVVLALDDGTTLSIAPLAAAGAVFELADLMAELSFAWRRSRRHT